MSRISKLMQDKKNGILNIYFTAGYPEKDSTRRIMKILQHEGVDLIELGMPYSDPLADGPVIQASSTRALQNGMTIPTLFDQLKGFRTGEEAIHLPVILMGYMNPVLQYGFEKFCKTAASVGIDGLILPDLPVVEYEKTYGRIIRETGLDFIFLVTPETPEERVRKLDELSSGFLYAVSSSSTTGKDKIGYDVEGYLKRLRSYRLKNPVLVGFGVRDKAGFDQASTLANGAIIGTAFIRALEKSDNLEKSASDFLKAIRSCPQKT